MHRQHFSKSYSDASHSMHSKVRIIIWQRCFQIITYRFTDGEIALPTRKMAAIAHKSELSGKQYMKSLGIEPISVILPNHVVTDMIPIPYACDFWKYRRGVG